MSSETSTRRAKITPAVADDAVPGFQPWHLFLIMTLIASAVSAVAVRGTRPANVVFICLTVMTAGIAAYAAYRMLWPLVQPDAVETPEMLGGRTRAALEREKTLVLRAIKDLEFDRAMGKVSGADWQEMTARLRGRAIRVIRQLDSGSAAYRELIEKELAARQAIPAQPAPDGRQAAAGARGAARLLVVAIVLGGLATSAPAGAQMGGTGGMAGMPDAKAMSGIPRPESTLAAGTVGARLLRGQFSNPIVGHDVEFIVNGKSQMVKTDEVGRAVANGLAPGSSVRVLAIVAGERIESQEFQLPPESGVVLLLVAADTTAVQQMEKSAVAGTVTLGAQSRVITQFEDEALQVYYLFDFVNATPAPVKTDPFVFDLPAGALNATVLEGSAPNGVAKGPRITVTGPFAPGITSVQVAYSLPPAIRVSVRQKLPLALGQVVVMAEKVGGMAVTSPQLTNIRDGNEGGKPLLVGTGPALKAGDVLALDITGLPHHPSWPRTTALALAAVVLAGGLWGALRTGGRSAAASARQQLEQRREQVFAELVRLEQRHRGGQLGDEAFGSRRSELLVGLERIYGELDTEATGPRGGQGLPA